MDDIDMNLLAALDVLLDEGSVTGAARRLNLSASAMSRTLTRLRAATGDPLLVRAGRGLVPTPHAAALRERVHAVTRDAQALLRPAAGPFDVGSLSVTFTIRASEAFIALLSAPLIATVTASAPRARLRFVAKPNKDAAPLREGIVDLEIGVIETSAPEMCAEPLFGDHFVGVVREGHPLLARPITAKRYAACRHVVASRKGAFCGPVDEALDALGLAREIVAVVPGFPDAIRIARESELVALVPRSTLGNALAESGAPSASGLVAFELPVHTPGFVISAMWHPRVDADPAHRWLRGVVMSLCRDAYPQP